MITKNRCGHNPLSRCERDKQLPSNKGSVVAKGSLAEQPLFCVYCNSLTELARVYSYQDGYEILCISCIGAIDE